MPDMNTAVVIPVGPGRIQNLLAVMDSLQKQTVQPRLVVLVCDGPQAALKMEGAFTVPTAILEVPKHEPGMEQPRNIGARLVDDIGKKDPRFAGITHLWFLDSDVIVRPRALEMYKRAYYAAEAWRCPECGTPDVGEDPETARCSKCGFENAEPTEENGWSDGWLPAHSIFVGPYDWLPQGTREAMPELRNDPDGVPPPGRWDRFDRHEPDTPVVNDMFAGLACFSGNLVWPIEEFKRVGGFWNELHHGRCEDGELGVRAVSMGVPITFVREARGWHLWHERDMDWVIATNNRDVPMLDARHPYLHGACTCGHRKEQHSAEELVKCPHPEGTHEMCDDPEVLETRYHGCLECECEKFEPTFFVVDEDGKRFNYRCEVCGEEMNAALSWGHRASHAQTAEKP